MAQTSVICQLPKRFRPPQMNSQCPGELMGVENNNTALTSFHGGRGANSPPCAAKTRPPPPQAHLSKVAEFPAQGSAL